MYVPKSITNTKNIISHFNHIIFTGDSQEQDEFLPRNPLLVSPNGRVRIDFLSKNPKQSLINSHRLLPANPLKRQNPVTRGDDLLPHNPNLKHPESVKTQATIDRMNSSTSVSTAKLDTSAALVPTPGPSSPTSYPPTFALEVPVVVHTPPHPVYDNMEGSLEYRLVPDAEDPELYRSERKDMNGNLLDADVAKVAKSQQALVHTITGRSRSPITNIVTSDQTPIMLGGVDIELVLDIEWTFISSQYRELSFFESQIRDDLAAALNVTAERFGVVQLLPSFNAGHTKATLRIFPKEGGGKPTAGELREALFQQLADKNSKLFHKTATKHIIPPLDSLFPSDSMGVAGQAYTYTIPASTARSYRQCSYRNTLMLVVASLLAFC